jgi:ribosomal protein S18 acetylase RimI-like enzyme
VSPSSAIRRATLSDLDVVRRLTIDAYRRYETEIGIVPLPVVDDYRLRIERGEVWILDVDHEAVGLAVIEEDADHVLLCSVAVRPDRQHRGCGLQLLRFVDERAADSGKREVRLYTNERMASNIALYRRFGFVQTGTRPHPTVPGHFVVDMVKMI